MAKKRSAPAPKPATSGKPETRTERERRLFAELAEAAPRKAAAKLIRALYGVNVPSSEKSAEQLEESTVKKMIAAELDGRRDRVPAILKAANPTKR